MQENGRDDERKQWIPDMYSLNTQQEKKSTHEKINVALAFGLT